MDNKLKILGIAGSLRKGSYHTSALRAASALVREDVELDLFDGLSAIPPYNQDDENDFPRSVKDLKKQIQAADAILFATPEYNYSIPGVLKNAIDWASRPYGQSAWDRKPVAIMSASVGMLGGARAQYHLRQIFVFLNMFPLNQPEVIIPEIQQKVDAEGNIKDEHTREKITELLEALVTWTIKLQVETKLPEEPFEKNSYDNDYNRNLGV